MVVVTFIEDDTCRSARSHTLPFCLSLHRTRTCIYDHFCVSVWSRRRSDGVAFSGPFCKSGPAWLLPRSAPKRLGSCRHGRAKWVAPHGSARSSGSVGGRTGGSIKIKTYQMRTTADDQSTFLCRASSSCRLAVLLRCARADESAVCLFHTQRSPKATKKRRSRQATPMTVIMLPTDPRSSSRSLAAFARWSISTQGSTSSTASACTLASLCWPTSCLSVRPEFLARPARR